EKKFSIRVVAKDYRNTSLQACTRRSQIPGLYQGASSATIRSGGVRARTRYPDSWPLDLSSPCDCTAAITSDIHPAVQRRVLARRRRNRLNLSNIHWRYAWP